MKYSDSTLQDLVDISYEAVIDPEKWQVFLERLVAVTSSDRAVLHNHWHESGDSGGTTSVGMDEGAMHAHRAHFWKVEPWWGGREPDRRNRPPVVYPHRHLAVPNSEYFHDWMRPWRIHDDACVTLQTPDGGLNPGLSVGLCDEQRLYSADDERLLTALIPDVSRALFLTRMFRRQRISGEHAAYDASAIGVVGLSARLEIVELNSTAQDLLGLEQSLSDEDSPAIRKGSLLASVRAPNAMLFADRRTQRALEAAVADARVHELGKNPATCFSIPRPGRTPLVAFVTNTPSSWFSARSLRVYVMDVKGRQSTPFGTWRTLWRFTPTECRVAAEMLAGLSIEEIAARNEVSSNAVRFHVKNMLSKTATRRQAALLLLLGRTGGFTPG